MFAARILRTGYTFGETTSPKEAHFFMFNTQHILYMVISGLLTTLLLIFAAKGLKTQCQKDGFLKCFAILTVILHYSDIWVDYFRTGGYTYVASVHILPVYPCNVMMWMLLIAAQMKNKQCLLFQMLSEFCFYGGILCGLLGITLNVNFDNTPTLADYGVLKGLLSHSTMLLGCIYMKVGKYFTVQPSNAVSVAAGAGIFVLCGVIVNGLYDLFGMEAPDGMLLRHNPYFPGSPILPGICVIILMYIVLLWIQRRKKKK